MIAIVDAYYSPACSGGTVAVGYAESFYTDTFSTEQLTSTDPAPEYESGAFYRRELPGIMQAFLESSIRVEAVMVDGYAMLSANAPGLGKYVSEALGVPVIGVAKRRFWTGYGIEVYRGGSCRPLIVTSAGFDPIEAADVVREMHGAFRLPTLIKRVDTLSRNRY